ncbi:GNAT family N-acetyltransferase [Citrobacter amalonaticus]|nr:GNAT family N-acetyltransferase [Citrobacter amalonaticus]
MRGELVAYARILKSAEDLEPVVIGRVIVSEALRGEKLGQQLMAQVLAFCQQHWPEKALYLGGAGTLAGFLWSIRLYTGDRRV